MGSCRIEKRKNLRERLFLPLDTVPPAHMDAILVAMDTVINKAATIPVHNSNLYILELTIVSSNNLDQNWWLAGQINPGQC
jgi:hypothetical protein